MGPCPHGCSIGCGCTTGWLPSFETAVRSYIEMCMMFDVVNENATRLRDALNVATEERDDALRRARVATQTIVAEIGADGPMSVEDAIMRMNLLHEQFLVFNNAVTHEINVVYRRDDETYGLVETTHDTAGAEHRAQG